MRLAAGAVVVVIFAACGGASEETLRDAGGDPTEPDAFTCPAGQQDHDGDGVCAEACSATACSGVGTCVDSGGQLLCACPDGYLGASCETCAVGLVRDVNGVCVFLDPIVNGSFTAAGEGWDSNATFTEVATFGPASACDGGWLTQTVVMPSRAWAGPRVLSFTGAQSAVGNLPRMLVKLGSAVHVVKVGANRICLGEGAYDGPLEVSFRTRPVPDCAVSYTGFTIDDVALVPAEDGDACPAESGLLNGSFDDAGDHWSATGSYVFGGGQVAITASGFTRAGISQRLAFPRASSTPMALSLQYSLSYTNDPIALAITVDGFTLTQVPAGADLTHRLCVPPWLLGSVHTLRIATVATAGSMSAAHTESLTITGVALDATPGCTNGSVEDGGFELGFANWWTGMVASGTTMTIPDDSTQARNGDRSGRIGVGRVCSIAKFATMVTPGSRVPGMGQAVELYARYPGTTSTSASVCLNVAGAHGGDCTDVAATAIYARHQLCLPAHAQGIPFYLVAVLNGGAGTCATFPTESLHIDDAAIIDTVDCP